MSAASKGGSGAYTADFLLSDTGDYLVTVTGVAPPGSSGTSGELDGSPYLLTIVPGSTSVYHSTAEGPGISAPQVGRLTLTLTLNPNPNPQPQPNPNPNQVGRLMWVAVTARDMYANARTQGGDRFALALEGPNNTRLTASSVVDYGNGTYNVTYLATVAGNYSLYAQRADTSGVFWDIRGSPFRVHVTTGPTNPYVSRMVGRHEVG